jgi:tRNA(Arg) A34 adenosine deaminase TadA
MTERDLAHLRAAVAAAGRARAHGNHPFGAVLADASGAKLLEAENTVLTARDVTGHAELNLVRLAWAAFERSELAGCTLYASTEPCAMCAAAIYWAGIGRVVFGLGAATLNAAAGRTAAHDTLDLPCRTVFAAGQRPVEIHGPLLEDEAWTVHEGYWAWRADGGGCKRHARAGDGQRRPVGA